MSQTSFFWFRRDLRLHDNTGLYHALKNGHPIQAIFIFDTHILDKLEDEDDARVHFIHSRLESLDKDLQKFGARLHVYHGDPMTIWSNLAESTTIKTVYTNRDYEPYALERDIGVKTIIEKAGATFKSYKDHVIFEKDEVLKADGGPYTVFRDSMPGEMGEGRATTSNHIRP